MINHIRTLLLNVSGTNRLSYDSPGEQYVPPSFTARTLSIPLQRVRRCLFGNSPDRTMLNYRLQQFLALLHGNELEEFVLSPDPRVTYLPFTHDLMDAVLHGAEVVQTAGTAKVFYVLGGYTPVESSGRLLQKWQVTVTDGTTVTVETYDADGRTYTTTYSYTVTDGLSSVLSLPGSGLSYRFESGTGSVWQVQVVSRPVVTMPQIVQNADSLLDASCYDALFSETEPYRTFKRLWETSDEPPYRLSGLVLALAYRTGGIQ